MNLSWTSQTHCGVLAPLKCWQETHPECQFWAVYGGKMRSDGPSRVGTFLGEHIHQPHWTVSDLTAAAVKAKATLRAGSCGSWRQISLEQAQQVCAWALVSLGVGREGRAALGPVCLYCCKPSTVILLKGCQQTPQSRWELPKQRVCAKIMSERGIKKLL